MREFPEDAVRTQDLLREFFPDEQWPSAEPKAEQTGARTPQLPAGRSMVVGVPSTPGQEGHDSQQSAVVPVTEVEMPAHGGAIEPASPSGGHRRSPLLLPMLAILLIGLFVGVVGYFVGTRIGGDIGEEVVAEQDPLAASATADVDADADADEAATGATDAPAVGSAEAGADQTVGSDESVVGADGTGDGATEDAAPAEGQGPPLIELTPNPTEWPGYPEDPADAPETGPYIIVNNGDFFLRGTVSTEETRQQLALAALQLVPLENVVLEYQLDPSDPFVIGDDIPVFFNDVVLFDADSELLNDEELEGLASLGVTFLLTDPTAVLTVVGHTDALGSETDNLDLSLRRAEAVRDLYIRLGAPLDRVIAVGRGESEPIATNETPAGRAENRRVVTVLGSVDR